MNRVYEVAGGRKLFFAIALMLIASTMTWFGKLESTEWVNFMKWIFGIYASGNVGEHIANAVKKKM